MRTMCWKSAWEQGKATLSYLAYRRDRVFWHGEGKTGLAFVSLHAWAVVHDVVAGTSCCTMKAGRLTAPSHGRAFHPPSFLLSAQWKERPAVFSVEVYRRLHNVLKGWIKKNYYFFPCLLSLGLNGCHGSCASRKMRVTRIVKDLSQHNKVLNIFFLLKSSYSFTAIKKLENLGQI